VGVKPIQIGLPLAIEGDAFASTTTTESPVGKEQLRKDKGVVEDKGVAS